MFARLSNSARNVVLAMAAAAWASGWVAAPAYGQHGGHAGHQHGSGPGDRTGDKQPAGPHGGQIAKVEDGTVEVVYQPKEIRVYLFGTSRKPVVPEDIGKETW